MQNGNPDFPPSVSPFVATQPSDEVSRIRLNRRRRARTTNNALSDITNVEAAALQAPNKKRLKRAKQQENIHVEALIQAQPAASVFKRQSARYKGLFSNLVGTACNELSGSSKPKSQNKEHTKVSKNVKIGATTTTKANGKLIIQPSIPLIEGVDVDYTDKDFNFDVQNEDESNSEFSDDDAGFYGGNEASLVSTGLGLNDCYDYVDEGDPVHQCNQCGALFWYGERLKKDSKSRKPNSFSMCCQQGKVVLPLLKPPPPILESLFFDKDSSISKNFRKNIRQYNNMFSFTSMGGQVLNVNENGGGPYSFVLSGMNYHRIGSLLPDDGERPVYSQLYIFDTENEVENRISAVSKHTNRDQLEPSTVELIKEVLDASNPFVKQYRNARTLIQTGQVNEFKLRLLNSRQQDGRMYNLPTASEVAALIVGDIDMSFDVRDIIVEPKVGTRQRINELHSAYLPLQYPLLFPYGEDGYRDDVRHFAKGMPNLNSRKRVSMREFFAFRLMQRESEVSALLHSSRLLQQFIVDGYTMMEAQRLR